MKKYSRYSLYLLVLLTIAVTLLITFKSSLFSKTINLTCKGSEETHVFVTGGRLKPIKRDKFQSVTIIRTNVPFSIPKLEITFDSDSFDKNWGESNISETNLYIKVERKTENEKQVVSTEFILNKVTKEVVIHKAVESFKNDSVSDIFFNGSCSEVKPL